MPDETELIRSEFDRAAEAFAERTKGRFDEMGAPDFAQVHPDDTVLEVGSGTGNFLALFEGRARRLVGLDVTPKMLEVAHRRFPKLELVQGDARRLPFRTGSVDIVASAQALHHMWEPIPVLMEMRRVAGPRGKVLLVDQHCLESYEQAAAMNELETIRDPSHAVSRPPSAFRIIMQSAGLTIVDENLWEGKNRLSQWMWPGEFPDERIAAVRDFIETRGDETGMEWTREGDDWTFTRRRIMLLARPLSTEESG